MSTTTPRSELLPKERQHNVAAMGGILQANKPVVGGYLADGRPSSSLFYWSHSHFTDDFEFGLHDHQGFEIITVILEGTNSHYDTATRRWADLAAGDVQIIPSGSGVSHNERVAKGARAFQIWFDPDFHSALKTKASYVDHHAPEFVPVDFEGFSITAIAGREAPVAVSTPGLTMRRVRIQPDAEALIPVEADHLAFCYVISGSAHIDGQAAHLDDLVTTSNATDVAITAGAGAADIFVITVPERPHYVPVRGR